MKELTLTQESVDIILYALKEQYCFDIALKENEKAAKEKTLINYLESL